jgi:flagellar motor switch protein FliG
VVLRLSRLKSVPYEVVLKIGETLREKVREWGQKKDEAPDGLAALTQILKSAPLSVSNRIIEDLLDEDPDIGKTLKESLYNIDDVIDLQNTRVLEEKLAGMDEKEIALLVKGRPDNFAKKILSSVSEGRRALIKEEGQYMGVVKKSDTDGKLKEFLAWFADMREHGRIMLSRDTV